MTLTGHGGAVHRRTAPLGTGRRTLADVVEVLGVETSNLVKG